MFIDYYALLELEHTATIEEIKAAYKSQALKWHPDRNPGVDTTIRMQQINEAYLILKDSEARSRYDQEYLRYRSFRQEKQQEKEKAQNSNNEGPKQAYRRTSKEPFEDREYQVFDETLFKWMSNARQQAVHLAKQTIDDIVGMSKASGKAMLDEIWKGAISLIVFSIFITIAVKACK